MGDEFMYAEPLKGPPTKLQLLHAWFLRHRFGRFFEFLFWAVPGALVVAFSWYSIEKDWIATPIALILALIGVCLIGFGALPQQKPAEVKAPNPKSLRAKRGK